MVHARTFLVISDSVLSLFSFTWFILAVTFQFVNPQKSHHNYNFFINTFLCDYLYIPNFYLLSSLSIYPVLCFIFKVFLPLKNKTQFFLVELKVHFSQFNVDLHFQDYLLSCFPNNSNALTLESGAVQHEHRV